MLDVNCVKHVDIFEIADKADKLIAARLYNSNELRRKVGDPEIPRLGQMSTQKQRTTTGATAARHRPPTSL